MKILFTGSKGFLATHLIKKFNHKNKIIKCDLPKMNINNFKKFFNYIKKNKPDIIIHTAAAKGALRSDDEPKTYIDTNGVGTLNICESARILKIKKIIYISSCSFYKRKNKILSENDENAFNNSYGFGKYIGEKIINFYGEKYGLSTLCLRPNLISGFGLKEDNLIYDLIKEIKINNTATIFGDGKHIREFIHPLDFYTAITSWLKIKEKTNYIMNITCNRFKIIDVAKRIIKFLGKGKIIYKNKNKRVFSVILSSQKIKKKLKWKSKYDLNYLIKDNYEYFK